MKEKEIEVKFLLTESQYDGFLSGAGDPVKLTNHYFLPETGTSSGFTLRIREEKGSFTLTRKTATGKRGEATVSTEENFGITEKQARDFLDKGISKEEMAEFFGGKAEDYTAFKNAGFLVTERRKVTVCGAECDLDKCEYSGKTDYELECEDSEKHEELVDFLKTRGITEQAPGKRKRFERRLNYLKTKEDTKMQSTLYKMMRMSEASEEDGLSEEEAEDIYRENHPKKDFKEEYKEFYTDIKISIKEDW